MVFKDRKEAGRLLGEFLKTRTSSKDTLVLGIPRGGVIVAKEVANILKAPLGVLIVKKLGLPSQPELAFGAIDPDGEVYIDRYTVEHFKLDQQSIEKIIKAQLQEIKDRENKFLTLGGIEPKGKEVLLVDDGIATGYTIIAGINYLVRHGARKVTVAVPVCPVESVSRLRRYTDEVYCYHQVEEGPYAVGMFYRDFKQVEDYEVEEALKG